MILKSNMIIKNQVLGECKLADKISAKELYSRNNLNFKLLSLKFKSIKRFLNRLKIYLVNSFVQINSKIIVCILQEKVLYEHCKTIATI